MRLVFSALWKLGIVFAAISTGVQPLVAATAPTYRGLNIGNPGLAGTAVENNGTFTLEGGGADIWDAADQFYLHYVRLPEAGYVVARVVSLENTDPWAKAGIMIRATGDANSAHAFMGVTAANGLAFQRRTATGSESEHTGIDGAAPRWVRLNRMGNFVTAAHSMDGIAWTVAGSVTLPLREYALVGLAVSSHNNATLATAVFDHVEIQEGQTGLYLGDLTWTDNGNGNGLPDPGEELTLTARVYNGGTVEAKSVTGSFSLSDSYASLISGQADFGSIPAGGFSEYRKFRFLLSPDVPKPHIVNLSLELKDFWGVVKSSTHYIVISESFTISGTVRWDNGEPLVNAHVICGNRGGTKEQVTDSQGRYILSMRPGDYTCRAELDKMPSPVVNVRVPPSISNVDFTFTPSLSVSGTVRRDNGNPVVAAFVSCSKGESYPFYYNQTDVLGRYTFSLATPGSYTCSARSEGYETPKVNLVVPPSQTGVNFTIPTFPTLSGTVRLSNGEPAVDAIISCHNGDESRYQVTDAQGRYTLFILKPGSYKCSATFKQNVSPARLLELPPSHADVDFVVLTPPELTMDLGTVSDTLEAGQTSSQPLVISNSGEHPLEFNFENTQNGYVWQDSDTPGGPAYAWIDIRNTGARLNMNSGMSKQVAVQTLSFDFPFYGNLGNTVYVAPSGYLTFVDDWYRSLGTVLPIHWAPKLMIAPFWGQIEARDVYFQEFPDRAVFQYDQAPSMVGSDTSTFQVVLHRDGTIRYYYNKITRPSLGVVGMQNEFGDKGFTLTSPYYKDIRNYPLIIKDGFAVEFRPLARDWFTASPASGSVPPGGSTTINIGLDAGPLLVGTYQGMLTLNNNARYGTAISLPISLLVKGAVPTGGLRREVWTGIPGTTLSALTEIPNYPRNPTKVSSVSVFESPQDEGDNYGQRLLGYLTPPITGDYTFFIAGDDNCELRFSTDEHPGRAVVIARVPEWTQPREWAKYPEQRSIPIRLEAGKKYYVEVLHKEGEGGDHVSVGWQGPGITGESERPIPASRLTPFDPTAWTGLDIGNPGLPGSQALSGNVFSVTGGGADIWEAADQFRFVYQPLVGDGEITARMNAIQNTDGWAKGGVMIRESLAADSRHAFTAVTATNGLAFQRRLATGGISLHTGVSGSAPRWVRLRREGNVFLSYVSMDGTTWTEMGRETIAMGAATWVGLAVTSHNNAVTTAGTFEYITVR